MIKTLYEQFQRWSEKGSVYIMSDPHFMDYDMNWRIRDVPTFMNLPEDEESVARTIAYHIVDTTNSVCHKNDTLIVLGDIGDVEWVKKLKADYKVLITGNHDGGVTKYKHSTGIVVKPLHTEKKFKDFEEEWGYVDGPGDWYTLTDTWNKYCKKCAIEEYKDTVPDFNCILTFEYNDEYEKGNPFKIMEPWNVVINTDNRLFDEVYDGPLFIAKNILLSHEPLNGPWINYHGHKHRANYPYCKAHHEYDLVFEVDYDWLGINCVCESNAFYPINLKKSIEEGGFAKFNDIHQITIDKAAKNKLKRIV